MTPSEWLTQLRAGDPRAFRKLYRSYPAVERYVRRNSGTVAQAEDLFQEALVVLQRRLGDPEFTLSTEPGGFVFGVCQRMWKKYLTRGTTLREVGMEEYYEPVVLPIELQLAPPPESLIDALGKLLDQLGEPCRSLLRLAEFDRLSMEVIAGKLGYANAHTARQQKYKCLGRLRKLVPADWQQLYLKGE